MFYQRKGFPEEDEIVLCQVTKLYPNSIFVDLLEFGESGMVHISEVAPGRIRNLRDFVSIGRQIVCKVLRVDRERSHIDLSLRRVNSTERREKLEIIKQELKAESLVVSVAKKLNKKAEEIYSDLSKHIFGEYSHLYLCFKQVAANEADLEKMGVNKIFAQELTPAIREKFKPPKISIQGEIKLKTYFSEGIEKIKSTLQSIEKASSTIKIIYFGGGRYKLVIEDSDYKSAEKTLKKIESILEKFNDRLSTAVFEREKKE